MNDDFGLPRLLPYMTFDGPVAVNVDGSLGLAWEISRWNSETAEPDALGQSALQLASLLRRMPDGAVLQWHLSIDRHPDWSAYLAHGSGILRDVAQSKVRTLETMNLRRTSLWVTLKTIPAYAEPPSLLFVAGPQSFSKRVHDTYQQERARFLELGRSVESGLNAAGLKPRPVTAEQFRARIFQLLNPGRARTPLGPADGPLREHVLYSNVRFDADRGLIQLGETPLAVVSVTELPPETRAGMLAGAWDALPWVHWVFNVHCPPLREIERFLKSKKRLAFCQERGRDYQADIASMKNEIDSLLTQMVVSGTRVVGSRIHALVPGADEADVNDRAHRLLQSLQSAGFGAIREGPMALTLFLQSLPLAYDPANDAVLKRARKLQDINLAHLAPVYRPFEGTRRPDILLVNRSGEPVHFSFFDGDLAPHGIICGISGSGKSVLANNIILEGLRRNARMFVLDRGGSYRKLAEFLNGQVVCLSPRQPLCVNPLGGELTQEKAIFATDFIAELLTAGRWDLGTRERSLVSQAVRLAHARGGSVTLSDLAEHLPEDLAVSMKLFQRGGPYGEYFDGPCGLDLARSLMIFELEDAALNKEISSALLMAIIQRITDACLSDPRQEKYLIIDEAWTLLKSPATARFLENVFRTFRKHRTCAIMISQQVTDFEGSAGEAIRANAPHRFFLRQTPDTLKVMERLLNLKPREKEVLSTLVTAKGQYSEMLVVSPSSTGVARLVQDPATYWLTTSDPADNAYMLDLLKKRPLRQALQAAAMRYPQGVSRGD